MGIRFAYWKRVKTRKPQRSSNNQLSIEKVPIESVGTRGKAFSTKDDGH